MTCIMQAAPLHETVTVVADAPIPNLPGKRLVSRVESLVRLDQNRLGAFPKSESSKLEKIFST